MTTCTWNFRRHAPRVLAATCLVALTSRSRRPRASADQISDLKAQASHSRARIQNLGRQEAALSEQYDGDVLGVQTLEGKVTQAGQTGGRRRRPSAGAKTALQADAIEAYVHGGSNPLTSSNPLSNATNSLLRAEYVNSLATNQNDAIDQYHLAALQEQAAKANLQKQTSAAQAAVQQVARARQAARRPSPAPGALNQDTGRIAVLVAQQQAAAAAAAAAARARLAAASGRPAGGGPAGRGGGRRPAGPGRGRQRQPARPAPRLAAPSSGNGRAASSGAGRAGGSLRPHAPAPPPVGSGRSRSGGRRREPGG